MKNKYTKRLIIVVLIGIFLSMTQLFYGCSQEPAWKSLNDKIIQEKNITNRTRGDLPETGVVPNLEPGITSKLPDIPTVELADGVTSKMYWGKGTLINWMTMEPGAEMPKETLTSKSLKPGYRKRRDNSKSKEASLPSCELNSAKLLSSAKPAERQSAACKVNYSICNILLPQPRQM